MARPKIELDKKQFESACGIQCTLAEIAALFDCSEDTVERWCKRAYGESFAEIYKKKSEKGKISLRRNQLRLSKTNATMAIWLGKQWLGQKDTMNANLTVSNPMQNLSDEELRALAKSNGTTETTDSG